MNVTVHGNPYRWNESKGSKLEHSAQRRPSAADALTD